MSLVTNVTNLATRIATEVKALRTLINGNASDLTALTTTAKNNLVASLNEIKGLFDALDSEVTTLSGNVTTLDGSVTSLDGDITALEGSVGTLASLTTTAKNSLVAAINEVNAALATAGVDIDDVTASSSTVYSSTKTEAVVSAAVAALVDSAPAALDTLNELAAALGDDADFATTITNALAGKASTSHTHAISDVTGLQSALDAKANSADVGDTTTNYVTTFEAGLV